MHTANKYIHVCRQWEKRFVHLNLLELNFSGYCVHHTANKYIHACRQWEKRFVYLNLLELNFSGYCVHHTANKYIHVCRQWEKSFVYLNLLELNFSGYCVHHTANKYIHACRQWEKRFVHLLELNFSVGVVGWRRPEHRDAGLGFGVNVGYSLHAEFRGLGRVAWYWFKLASESGLGVLAISGDEEPLECLACVG